MCGISGIIKPGDNTEIIKTMLSSIYYRGPDEYGCLLSEGLALGIARLSIVDVKNGHQPMVNVEKGVGLVFNGEIFNYKELRASLQKKGHIFNNESDTEVLLNLYIEYGIDFVQKINGQFAISIFDKSRNKLFLLRDRLGIRPLFYSFTSTIFLFASEIKSILATRLVERELEPRAIDQIFTFWTTINQTTAFKNIYSLMPGSVLEVDISTLQYKKSTYWDWPFPSLSERISDKSEDEYVALFRLEFEKAVSMRMVADVEVGAYLSGGIDSSAVISVAKEYNNKLKTYSIEFESASYDESEAQKIVCSYLKVNRKSILCKNEDIGNSFEEVIWHTEQPIFRTAPVPLYLLSELVNKEGLKVVLTGEGSDEILLGYDIFRELVIREFWKKFPESKIRPLLFRKLYAYLPQFKNPRYSGMVVDFYKKTLTQDSHFYSHQPRWENSIFNKRYYSKETILALKGYDAIDDLKKGLPKEFFLASGMDKAQYLEVVTLLQGYLLSSQADRMAMGNSVEGRYPFLDHEFIEFVNKLPANIKLKGFKDKYILRKCFEKKLPEGIIHRSKVAYQAPDIRGFINNNTISALVLLEFSKDRISEVGIFSMEEVSNLLRRIENSRLDRTSTRDNLAFVQMLSTQILQRLFISDFEKNLKKYSREIELKYIVKLN